MLLFFFFFFYVDDVFMHGFVIAFVVTHIISAQRSNDARTFVDELIAAEKTMADTGLSHDDTKLLVHDAEYTLTGASLVWFSQMQDLGEQFEIQAVVGTIALLLAFIKTLEHLRINRRFAAFLLEIYMMVIELLVFMLIFVFFILGFSFFYYILNAQTNKAYTSGILGSLLYTFGTSTMGGIEYPHERDYIIIIYIAYVVFVLIISILMLNLLIAVMSDGYSRVQEGAAAFWCYKQCVALKKFDDGHLEMLPTKLGNSTRMLTDTSYKVMRHASCCWSRTKKVTRVAATATGLGSRRSQVVPQSPAASGSGSGAKKYESSGAEELA